MPVSPDVIGCGVPLPPTVGAPSPSPSPSGTETPPRHHRPHRGGPPIPSTSPSGESGSCGPSYVTSPYPSQPNILLIMVDQLRAPRWVPERQQSYANSLTPNIHGLQQTSFDFPNFFVAATKCTPSRATLLTGLYAQQTCMFETQSLVQSQDIPSLQPWVQQDVQWKGFPTIGDMLSQTTLGSGNPGPAYDCAWIGKWHVSDYGGTGQPGSNGPSDYGFSNKYCIPPNPSTNPYQSTYYSPNGMQNEGTAGDFLDGVGHANCPQNDPNYPATVSGLNLPAADYLQLSDAAISQAFSNTITGTGSTGGWLQNQTTEPWFCAVSFVNPHDMSDFPHAYAYAGETCGSADFGCATSPTSVGYQPPPTAGYVCQSTPPPACQSDPFAQVNIPPLPNPVFQNTAQLPANYNDNPANQPYTNTPGSYGGKPGLQTYYQTTTNGTAGAINTANGWLLFLQYYYWMQNCVDAHVGEVLTAIQSASSSFTQPIMIVFTADHGEYGGSHWLHAKGGALYDEVMNVPLYISWVGQSAYHPRTFVCSSVDILPFLYSMALGNEDWRCGVSKDNIQYPYNRESIRDAIYQGDTATQRRVSDILNSQGTGYQPYVLHTTDEYSSAGGSPSHAIAFRTVDTTLPLTQGNGQTSYGGGKLGMYTYWPNQSTWPDNTQQANFQFEFYNYSNGNYGETGNDAFTSGNWEPSGVPAQFLASYNSSAVQSELYSIPAPLTGSGNAYQNAFADYMVYLGTCTEGTSCPPPSGSPPTITGPSS